MSLVAKMFPVFNRAFEALRAREAEVASPNCVPVCLSLLLELPQRLS